MLPANSAGWRAEIVPRLWCFPPFLRSLSSPDRPRQTSGFVLLGSRRQSGTPDLRLWEPLVSLAWRWWWVRCIWLQRDEREGKHTVVKAERWTAEIMWGHARKDLAVTKKLPITKHVVCESGWVRVSSWSETGGKVSSHPDGLPCSGPPLSLYRNQDLSSEKEEILTWNRKFAPSRCISNAHHHLALILSLIPQARVCDAQGHVHDLLPGLLGKPISCLIFYYFIVIMQQRLLVAVLCPRQPDDLGVFHLHCGADFALQHWRLTVLAVYFRDAVQIYESWKRKSVLSEWEPELQEQIWLLRELTSCVSHTETNNSEDEEDAGGSHAHRPGMTVEHLLGTTTKVR